MLPNRLEAVEFEPVELETILGVRPDEQSLQADSFNWVAAYLCEEVGITELDLARWFRREVDGLSGQSPLEVWPTEDGYNQVFRYAQQYKRYADEVLSDSRPNPDDVPRSYQIAERALIVIGKAFEVAGVKITPSESESMLLPVTAIHNPAKPKALMVTWKGSETLGDYKITKREGSKTAEYMIAGLVDSDDFSVFQTGIFRHDQESGEPVNLCADGTSDIDGRPPSAGEIAEFVVPLAVEVKNKTLWLIEETS